MENRVFASQLGGCFPGQLSIADHCGRIQCRCATPVRRAGFYIGLQWPRPGSGVLASPYLRSLEAASSKTGRNV
jgi:hypothetical protein